MISIFHFFFLILAYFICLCACDFLMFVIFFLILCARKEDFIDFIFAERCPRPENGQRVQNGVGGAAQQQTRSAVQQAVKPQIRVNARNSTQQKGSSVCVA